MLIGLEEGVDLADESVGQLLDRVLGLEGVVLRNLLLSLELLDHLVGVSANRANGDAAFFRHLVEQLRQLLAALHGERRNG